jgi:hypothetical protein
MTDEKEDAERVLFEANVAFDDAWAFYRESWTKKFMDDDARDVERASEALDTARTQRNVASERLKTLTRREEPSA